MTAAMVWNYQWTTSRESQVSVSVRQRRRHRDHDVAAPAG